MQAQYRPSYRAPLESSLDEPRIGKTLAVYGLNKTVEPCQRVPFHVSIIQAEGEFINVAMQVLRAGMMVDAVHPALHYRPNALDRVRVDSAPAVFPGAMVHGFMAEKQSANSSVSGCLISHKLRTNLYVLKNSTLQALFIYVGNRIGDGASTALSEADYSRLADRSASGAEFLRFVLVGFLAAEKGFISFDNAFQFGEFAAASLTESMEHEPCGFLLDADFFGDLHGGDSFAGRHKQVHGVEPFVKRDMRTLEDGSGTDCEVKLALIAAVKTSLAGSNAVLSGASRAGDAFRPEARFKVEPRRGLIGEHLEQLEGADCGAAHLGNLFHRGDFIEPTVRPHKSADVDDLSIAVIAPPSVFRLPAILVPVDRNIYKRALLRAVHGCGSSADYCCRTLDFRSLCHNAPHVSKVVDSLTLVKGRNEKSVQNLWKSTTQGVKYIIPQN